METEIKNTKRITKKQQAVLDFIASTIDETGIAPTVRDICDGLGLSSPSTVHVHLKTLEDKGLIRRDPLKSRCITVIGHERAGDADNARSASPAPIGETVLLPVVGNVAAGNPILAEQNITETIPLPTAVVGDSGSFLLKVRGDSMTDIGINDGDYVVVEQTPTADNGDIVVAVLEDGATVKRFFRDHGAIRLQPENASMEPIVVHDDIVIAGKVIAVFRRL